MLLKINLFGGINTDNNLIYYLQYYQNFIYMSNKKVISKNIKRLCNKLGLMQDNLTKKADINLIHYAYENQKRNS